MLASSLRAVGVPTTLANRAQKRSVRCEVSENGAGASTATLEKKVGRLWSGQDRPALGRRSDSGRLAQGARPKQ